MQSNGRLTRRYALATAAAAVSASALAACGNQGAQPSSSGGGAQGKGQITFMARGDDAIFKVFRDLRDAFQKEQPGIAVTIDEVPGDWYQKFQLQLASGTPPDASFESANTITTSARNGALEPLDDYMKKDRRFNKADYWDICFTPSMWKGKTYHLPYDGGSQALFYNQDLFKAAGVKDLDPKNPITWDQLLDISRTLTLDQNDRHPGDSGFDPARMKQYGFNPSSYWVYVFGNGGELVNTDGTVPIDSAATVEGLQWRADAMAKKFVSPSPEYQQSSPLSFATGNVAMSYDGVWSSVRYRQNKFAWDVAPFPRGKAKVSTGWYSGLSVMAPSKLKDAAWEWVFFCCSEPGQRIVSGLGQAVPGVKKLASTDVFIDGSKQPPKSRQVFLDELDAKVLRLPGDKFGSPFGGYWREFGQIFDPIFDAVWRGKRTAADAAREARPKLEKLIKTGEVT
jgi:multiple sugar transport system substrate-binding protein